MNLDVATLVRHNHRTVGTITGNVNTENNRHPFIRFRSVVCLHRLHDATHVEQAVVRHVRELTEDTRYETRVILAPFLLTRLNPVNLHKTSRNLDRYDFTREIRCVVRTELDDVPGALFRLQAHLPLEHLGHVTRWVVRVSDSQDTRVLIGRDSVRSGEDFLGDTARLVHDD